jgi:hypothetical protein
MQFFILKRGDAHDFMRFFTSAPLIDEQPEIFLLLTAVRQCIGQHLHAFCHSGYQAL